MCDWLFEACKGHIAQLFDRRVLDMDDIAYGLVRQDRTKARHATRQYLDQQRADATGKTRESVGARVEYEMRDTTRVRRFGEMRARGGGGHPRHCQSLRGYGVG